MSLGFFIIGGFASQIFENFMEGKLNQHKSDTFMWFNFFLVFFTLLVIVSLTQIHKHLVEIKKTKRLSIRYLSVSDDHGKDLYVEAKKFIEDAKEDGSGSIFAVNSYVEIYEHSEDEAKEDYRKRYLHTLEQKVGKTNYHRIIQINHRDFEKLKSGEFKIGSKMTKNYRQHYRNMILARDAHKGNGYNLQIGVVPAKYPISFVVVTNNNDTNYLIWQMHEHVDGSDAIRLTGIFLIIDPDEQLVKYFKEWFNILASNQNYLALKSSYLNEDA